MRLFVKFRNRFQKRPHKIIIPEWKEAEGTGNAEHYECPKRTEIETLFVRELKVGKVPERYFKNYSRKKKIAAHRARKRKLCRREPFE